MFSSILAALFSFYFLGFSTRAPMVPMDNVQPLPAETQIQSNANLDEFADCLKEKGATFYGAFWCPHCQAQKALFGKSVEKLPYVECSTPDGNGQLEVCTQAGVQSYPTWHFLDGSETTGTQSLQALSEKTGCSLPLEVK